MLCNLKLVWVWASIERGHGGVKVVSDNNDPTDEGDSCGEDEVSGYEDSDVSAFDREQRELTRWPYAIHAIDDSLDADLIEGRGKQLLFQSLSFKNTVAFVGSGVSMAYGRLSWNEWLDHQHTTIDENAKAYCACAGALQELYKCVAEIIDVTELKATIPIENGNLPTKKLTAEDFVFGKNGIDFVRSFRNKSNSDSKSKTKLPSVDSAFIRLRTIKRFLEIKATQLAFSKSEIERLHRTFSHLKEKSSFAGGELSPICFQVAEQLHDHLQSEQYVLAKNIAMDEKYRKLGSSVRDIKDDDEFSDPSVMDTLIKFLAKTLPKSDSEQIGILLDTIKTDMTNPHVNFREFPHSIGKAAKTQEAFVRRRTKPDFEYPFAKMAKMLLVDECAHAEAILEKSIGYGAELGRPIGSDLEAARSTKIDNHRKEHPAYSHEKHNNLRRDIKGIRQKPERYWSLGYFKTASVTKICEHTGKSEIAGNSHWRSILNSLKTQLSMNLKESKNTGRKLSTDRTFIAPSHRFVVEMLTALHEDPLDLREQGNHLYAHFSNDKENEHKVSDDDFRSRLSIIDEELDPIAKLSMNLGINRYLTLNYDFEIERLYQDRGYRRFAIQDDLNAHVSRKSDKLAPEDHRLDGMGGIVVDGSFERSRATELIDFAFDDSRADARVYHLHGHAAEDSRLIITERDYMDLYLRNDRYRDVVNESISAAFSADPLLFVGLGMGEPDVLRPLRQFMSDQASASTRSAIALFPAFKDEAERARDSAGLYLRYGVHTVYFGSGSIVVKRGETYWEQPVDWLHRITCLIDVLVEINEEWLKPFQAIAMRKANKEIGEKARLLIEGIDEKWHRADKNPYHVANNDSAILARIKASTKRRNVEFLGKKTTLASNYDVLSLLFGHGEETEIRLDDLDGDLLELKPCRFTIPRADSKSRVIDASSATEYEVHDNYLKFERQLLAQLLRATLFTKLNRFSASPFQDAIAKKDTAKPGSFAAIGGLDRNIRELRARIIGLNGLKNAINTGVLCASLDLVDHEWRQWWHRWKLTPPHRKPLLDKLKLAPEIKDGDPNSILPVRYVRHMLDNVITDFSDCERVLGSDDDRTSTPSDGIRFTGVRSFDNFLESIRNRTNFDERHNLNRRGRRMHLVAANRGLGKGTFLSAFITPLGLGEYILASSAIVKTNQGLDKPKTPIDVYLSAIFINLSFSTEIASTIDMLNEALIDASAALDLMLVDKCATVESAREVIEGILPDTHDNAKNYQGLRKKIASVIGRMPRLVAMEALLKGMRQRNAKLSESGMAITGNPVRILIVLSAIELLDYEGGLVKNREIQEFLDLLTKDALADVPIDLVLIASEHHLGPPFAMSTAFIERYTNAISNAPRHQRGSQDQIGNKYHNSHGNLAFIPITRSGVDFASISYVRQREERSKINFVEYTTEASDYFPGQEPRPDPTTADIPKSKTIPEPKDSKQLLQLNICSVYFARALQPESLLVDNFLPLAATLFVNHTCTQLQNWAQGESASNPKSTLSFGRDGDFGDWSIDRTALDDAWKMPNYQQRKVILDGVYAARTKTVSKSVAKYLKKVIDQKHSITAEEEKILGFGEHLINAFTGDGLKSGKLQEILLARYGDGPDVSAFREWREIRKILRANRYSLTILLSAAQRIALSEQEIMAGARRAEAFIRKTIDHVSSVSESARGQAVLSNVLEAYEHFHVIGEPRYDVELHRLILRQLSVVGTPCSADVLVRMPQIRDYFDSLTDFENISRSRKLQLVEALTEIAERGLVFRIKPQPSLAKNYQAIEREIIKIKSVKPVDRSTTEKENLIFYEKKMRRHFRGIEPKGEFRYALHRLVQRHIVNKMGAGPRDFVSINSFAPSLYASMPADLPRLTPDAYSFLRVLVSSLSQYPDRRRGEKGTESWHFSEATLSTRVQALRAALSIVRSTFSVAVVSRFEDYKLLEPRESSPLRGYFEIYRIQVRWLIRKGLQLLDRATLASQKASSSDDLFEDYDPQGDHEQIVSFYRDEVVWLYNECGLICLVQGNLLDAVALLRQALHLNSQIEGEIDGGAHQNRISLNLAVAQIERGRIDAAQERLSSICQSEERFAVTKGRIWHLAYGYLGLTHQIKGDFETAAEHFQTAVVVLRAYNDSRACTTFCRHMGDIERARGDFAKARAYLNESIGYAEAGGHEDKHKQARLALVRLEIAENKAKPTELIRSLFNRIQTIIEYAEAMEMPSLLCEAYNVKAQLLLEQGETTLAGKILSQAMAMAKRNGMLLRLNSAMTSYARVLAMRDMRDQARRLLFTCLEMAKHHRNQLEIRRVEEAFDLLG